MMVTKYLQNKSILNACRLYVVIVLVFFAIPAFSQSIPSQITSLNAQNVLQNIATQIPMLMQLLTAIAYVMGMYFVFAALIKFKHYGESRTMMSQEHNLATPMIMILVGAALLYLPESVNVGMSTFWSNPNPYGYVQQQDQWATFLNDCYLIIQFIGTLAFIRGLVILSHLGGHHGGQGNFGRGLTHIIGGILCINIYQFVQVVLSTIGIQS